MLVFALAWTVLFASFGFNAFGVVGAAAFHTFQSDSDELVTLRLQAIQDGEVGTHHGFLVRRGVPDIYLRRAATPRDAHGREPYMSQFGLQGIVLGALTPRPGRSVASYVANARLASALLLALLLALYVTLLGRSFGAPVAMVTLVLLAWSPWLVLFARSLYWQLWSYFVPLLAVALAYPADATWRRVAVVSVVAFSTVLLRSLAGYEYATNVVLSCAVPVLFRGLRAAMPLGTVLRHATAVVLSAGLGVGAAIVAHVTKLAILLGSWAEGRAALVERVAARSYGASGLGYSYAGASERLRRFVEPLGEHCGSACQDTLRLAQYLLHPAVTLPGSRVSLPVGAVIVLVALLMVAQIRRGLRQAAPTALTRILTVPTTAAFALVASASWALAMFNHMMNHPHINAIIFYIPFLPIAYAIVAMTVLSWAKGRTVVRLG